MTAHRRSLPWLAVALIVVTLPRPLESQRWKERLEGAVKRTTDAAKKAATDQTRQELDSAIGDAVGAVVEDGRFAAVLSPWSGDGGAGRAELARFSGEAVVTNAGGSQRLMLCNEDAARPWSATFLVSPEQNRGAARARDDRPPPAATGDYDFPSERVSVSVTDPGARIRGGAEGSLKVASIADDLWVGTAKLTFARVALPRDPDPEAVEFAASFRAKVLRAGETMPKCGASGAPGTRVRR